MMNQSAQQIEEKANRLLVENKYAEAYKLLKKAAHLYRIEKNLRQAALCSALAASCWSTKSGEKRFINAALSYEQAASDAQKCGDLEYASLLYKQAAINYERDREFIGLSECLYRSKECYRKFLTYLFIKPSQIHHIIKSKQKKGARAGLKRFWQWATLTLSYLIWGHGERPSRTIITGLFLIVASALLYRCGYLLREQIISRPTFLESLYFSVITFTTVGFGDVTAVGFSRLVAMLESLCAIFIVPIFIIGFSRKYLRF